MGSESGGTAKTPAATEKKVRKRPDRAEKLLERQVHNETVVKCALTRLLRPSEHKQPLVDAIRNRVDAYSKRVHAASLGMNLLIKRAFRNAKMHEFHNVKLPADMFEQTFVRQLMLGTEDASDPYEEITTMFRRNTVLSKFVTDLPRHNGDRNIYSSGAIKYKTNLLNHYVTNLESWIKKWVYSKYVKSYLSQDTYKETVKAILYNICNWKQPDAVESRRLLEAVPGCIQKWITIQKAILGDANISKGWYKLKASRPKMVRYAVFINRFFSKISVYEGQKLTNVAPICSIRCHFTAFDGSTLWGLLRELKLTSAKQEDTNMIDEWNSVFRLNDIQATSKTFTGTVETDGTSICVHFTRPKSYRDGKEIPDTEAIQRILNDPTAVVLGVDPGRTNIFCMVMEDPEEEGVFKKLVLSRNTYYNGAGVKKAAVRTQLWQSSINRELGLLSTVSSKGDSLDDYLFYLDMLNRVYHPLWDEYTKQKWGSQRLRLYGGKKRMFAKFFNKVQETVEKAYGPNRRIILAYGAAKFSPGGKGEISVPTSRAYKECRYRFLTLLVDEYRTTKLYWRDPNNLLEKVKSAKTRQTVRGLHWCSSTTEKSKFVDRDVNAAINIRNCLVQGRPENMRRSPLHRRLEPRVGRWVVC